MILNVDIFNGRHFNDEMLETNSYCPQELGSRCDFYFCRWPFFSGWKLQFGDNKEGATKKINIAHMQVFKPEGSIFLFSIHLSRQIPGKLSFITKNRTEYFGNLLKPCQKCIFWKFNISHRVLQIFCPHIK